MTLVMVDAAQTDSSNATPALAAESIGSHRIAQSESRSGSTNHALVSTNLAAVNSQHVASCAPVRSGCAAGHNALGSLPVGSLRTAQNRSRSGSTNLASVSTNLAADSTNQHGASVADAQAPQQVFAGGGGDSGVIR